MGPLSHIELLYHWLHERLFFPLSSLVEVEATGEKLLILPLSSLVEVEAIGAFRAGLEGSVSALLEVEAAGERLLIFPLSSLVEVEADLPRLLTFPLSSLVEVEADLTLVFLWSFIKDHQIQLDIWGTEQHIH